MNKGQNFDQLNEFPKSTNFIQIMREVSDPIINNKSDEEKLNSVIDLRRLRKFHLEFFNKIFSNLYEKLLPLIQTVKNNEELTNAVLQLLKEVFNCNEKFYYEISDWVRTFVPVLLVLATNPSHGKLANEILMNIVNCMFYSEIIQSFLDEILRNESEEINNIAINYLFKNLEAFDLKVMIEFIYWDICLEIITEIIAKKSEIGNKIISFFTERLGYEAFEKIVDENAEAEVHEKIVRIIGHVKNNTEIVQI